MECIIDLEKLNIVEEPYAVFYSTDKLVCYKNKNQIVLENNNGDILDVSPLPIEYNYFQIVDLEEYLAGIFNGRHVVALSKRQTNTSHPDIQIIDSMNINRCSTELFPGTNNTIIFGSQSMYGCHVIKFDPVSCKILCQTSSWKLKNFDSLIANGEMIYGLLDNSVLITCDMSTGKIEDFRFEAGHIIPKIVLYKNDLIYFISNILNRVIDKKVDKTRIPGYKITSIHDIKDNYLYFTADNNKTLISYNLIDNSVKWEIKSESEFKESLFCQGKHSGKIMDIMVMRSENGIHLINTKNGSVVKTISDSDFYKIRKTSNHILLHRKGDRTSIMGI